LAENIRLDIQNLQKIILVGHTDDVGTNEYNIGLGSRRVNFVKSELIKRGVPGEIIETRTAGEGEPLGRRPGEELDMFRKRLRRVTVEKIF
jgi:OOP family OmpA-OmpF porin